MADRRRRSGGEQRPGEQAFLRLVVPSDHVDTVMFPPQQPAAYTATNCSGSDADLSQLARGDSPALPIRHPGNRLVWALKCAYAIALKAHTSLGPMRLLFAPSAG
jgi:hypothetical protein